MVFFRKCASENLHRQWNVPADGALRKCVAASTKATLLNLAQKHEQKHYSKSKPSFCIHCIAHVEKSQSGVGTTEATTTMTALVGTSSESTEEATDTTATALMDTSSGSNFETTDVTATATALVDTSESQVEPTDASALEGTSHETDIEPDTQVDATSKFNVSSLTVEERRTLTLELAALEAADVKQFALEQTQTKQNVESLIQFDPSTALGNINSVVQSFILGLSSPSAKKDHYQLYKAVESVASLSAWKTALPLHFRESLLIYAATGSKLALQVLGAAGAHSSYKAVKSWLANLEGKVPKIPEEDIVVAFDNNQVLLRRWKVRLHHTVLSNVVTIVVYFLFNSSKLQYQYLQQLKPAKWQKGEIVNVAAIKYPDVQEKVKHIHYEFLHIFLDEQIKKVLEEQDQGRDKIDEKVQLLEKSKLYKRCYSCNFTEVPKTRRTCPACNTNVTKGMMRSMGLNESGYQEEVPSTSSSTAHFRVHFEGGVPAYQKQDSYKEYDAFQRFSPEVNRGKVHVHEPVYVNPCSYEATTTVLRSIGQRFGVVQYGGKREWLVVVCDGIPYNLCRRIMLCSFVCGKCQEPVEGDDGCADHNNAVHPGETVEFILEFGWVLLRPGSGHIEMNMVKGIVELGWEVIFRKLAQTLNYRSEIALQSAKKVNDHHKGWTMCRIARYALARELILPFVRQECSKTNPVLTVSNFMKFMMNAEDPNYTFMCDYTFELLDSVFLYRTGVRCGIPDFREAGMAKYAKVWSGRNHPLYRELEAADTIQRARMPENIAHLAKCPDSVQLSEVRNTGEGADFRLEEVNRIVQQWLPNVPTLKDWAIACGNFDKLSNLRRLVFQQMGVQDPKLSSESKAQNIDQEVEAFRTVLRSTGYLLAPSIKRDHVSIDGTALAPELRDFCKMAREKRASYVEEFLTHETRASLNKPSPPTFRVVPVFVTEMEKMAFNAITNQTIEQIKAAIGNEIEQLDDADARESLSVVFQEMTKKRPKKQDLISLYEEIQDVKRSNRGSTPDDGDVAEED